MRDIRSDWYDTRTERQAGAARLVVACDAPGCGHAALVDPRPLFGARRFWPATGRSERFRCRCGSRVTRLSYTINAAQREGPISVDAIRLWT